MAEEKTVNFELTVSEVNKLFLALNKQKIGTYLPIYNKIQTQVYAQMNNVLSTNENNRPQGEN